MMLSLGFLLFTVVLLDASSGGIAADRVLARRIALVNNLVRSALLFWPVIFTPLVKYCIRDVAYAEQFSVGLAPTVTPAILRYTHAWCICQVCMFFVFVGVVNTLLSYPGMEPYPPRVRRNRDT